MQRHPSNLHLAICTRKALEHIAENADLIEVEGAEPFLLVQTMPALIDILAVVCAEADDRENDLEDEQIEEAEAFSADSEPDDFCDRGGHT